MNIKWGSNYKQKVNNGFWKVLLEVRWPKYECYLTFRGPCIMIYSYNKTNEMH